MTSYSEFAGSAKDQYLRFFHTPNPVTELRRSVAYRFESHFHPFASEQAKEFIRLGVDGAMGADDSWDLDLYDAGDIIVLEAGSFKTQDGQVRQLRGRTISPPLPAPNTGGTIDPDHRVRIGRRAVCVQGEGGGEDDAERPGDGDCDRQPYADVAEQSRAVLAPALAAVFAPAHADQRKQHQNRKNEECDEEGRFEHISGRHGRGQCRLSKFPDTLPEDS